MPEKDSMLKMASIMVHFINASTALLVPACTIWQPSNRAGTMAIMNGVGHWSRRGLVVGVFKRDERDSDA